MNFDLNTLGFILVFTAAVIAVVFAIQRGNKAQDLESKLKAKERDITIFSNRLTDADLVRQKLISNQSSMEEEIQFKEGVIKNKDRQIESLNTKYSNRKKEDLRIFNLFDQYAYHVSTAMSQGLFALSNGELFVDYTVDKHGRVEVTRKEQRKNVKYDAILVYKLNEDELLPLGNILVSQQNIHALSNELNLSEQGRSNLENHLFGLLKGTFVLNNNKTTKS